VCISEGMSLTRKGCAWNSAAAGLCHVTRMAPPM
jgi:hypothetical protein